MAEQMQAWVLTKPGPIEASLVQQSIPRLTQPLKPDQVLIKTLRASINPADYKAPELGIASRAMLTYPKTIGMDCSGEVVSIGDKAKEIGGLEVGDRVMARIAPFSAAGALGEYTSVERDGGLAKVPADFDMDQAAGAPTVGLTAIQSIKPYVKPGDKIFINGGSGGVGTCGIQVAKLLDCSVTVSCSTGKIDLCKSLGADEIIDYTKQDVIEALKKTATDSGKLFDHVVDMVGHSPNNLAQNVHHFTTESAQFVFVGGSTKAIGHMGSALLTPSFLGGPKRKVAALATKNIRTDFELMAGWMAEGKMKIIVDKVFKLEQTSEAYAELKKGKSAGKLIIEIA